MPYKTINAKMESFKFFFESKDADIEDLKKMIKNPDPSKVKEYGDTKYVDMLKKKLARLEEDEQVKVRKGGAGKAFYTGTRVEKNKKKEESKKQARGKVKEEDAQDEVIYINDEDLIYPYSNYGYRYKGYQLEVQKETEPGERDFYFFDIYDEKGNKLKTPNNLKLISNYGELNEQDFKSYIDSLSNNEDAEDRCKRKADSVYGKKTSAYKSGAIVRCRKGKIWKKK